MSVYDRHAQALKMSEVAEGIKDCVAVSSQISRGAHSVKEERIPVFTRARVVRMAPCVDRDVRNASFVQLVEQWKKPLLMLVEDPDWLG